MDGLVHRPVPDPPARWLQPTPIARLSGPSITTYTPMVKVQAIKSTIYEMSCSECYKPGIVCVSEEPTQRTDPELTITGDPSATNAD